MPFLNRGRFKIQLRGTASCHKQNDQYQERIKLHELILVHSGDQFPLISKRDLLLFVTKVNLLKLGTSTCKFQDRYWSTLHTENSNFESMRIMFPILLVVSLLFVHTSSAASNPIWYVFFSDKPAIGHIEDDFDAKALERRTRFGIEFPQENDLPLAGNYVAQVGALVDSVRFELRWFNAVTVVASEWQIEKVQELPFVKGVELMEPSEGGVAEVHGSGWEGPTQDQRITKAVDTAKIERLVVLQRKMIGLDLLKANGLDGSGVRIAIFDAGFAGADTHPGFQHLRDNEQIVDTWDFYGNDAKVYHHGAHGTMVLSCLAGMYDERNLGAATGAEFLLARTEHGLWEKIKEEDCWLAAVEWADRKGADMISSSLGYGKKRYTCEDMDGETAPVSRAAQIADSKGIVVVNSAGNTGNEKVKCITAPADAPTVITVGSSYPMMAYPMPYTAHGRYSKEGVKPDVAGPGYVVAADRKGGYDFTAGTSFACPSIAGVVACIKQKHPSLNTMEIRSMVRSLGHFFPFYTLRMGYGIPQVENLFQDPEPRDPEFQVLVRNDSIYVQFDQEAVNRDTAEQRNGKPCFVQWTDGAGQVRRSHDFLIKPKQGLGMPLKEEGEAEVWIWFEGTFWSSEEGDYVK